MIAIDVGEPPYFPLHHSHAACVTALCGFLSIGLVVSMVSGHSICVTRSVKNIRKPVLLACVQINMRTGYRVMWICSLFCLMEVAGFSCRLVMLRTASFPVYTSMQGDALSQHITYLTVLSAVCCTTNVTRVLYAVFLVVSPVFLCLINYIITGRLGKMGSGSEKKHRLVSWTFLFSDLLSLAIQVGAW